MQEEWSFEGWQQGWKRRMAAMRERLLIVLKAGKIVGEAWHGGSAQVRLWPNCAPFLPEYKTPEYIADHLINRHGGFGTILYVDGVAYRLGLPMEAGQ